MIDWQGGTEVVVVEVVAEVVVLSHSAFEHDEKGATAVLPREEDI